MFFLIRYGDWGVDDHEIKLKQYNHEKPHSAINKKTPISLIKKGQRYSGMINIGLIQTHGLSYEQHLSIGT